MSTTTITPPPELADAELVALVVPFDEESRGPSEFAGSVYSWGDVRLPRGELPVLAGHDGEQVGIASHWVQARSGIWCQLKLGRRAEQILRRGAAVSSEIPGDTITHVALLGDRTPGFASARVYGPATADGTLTFSSERGYGSAVAEPPLRLGVSPVSGLVGFRPLPAQTRGGTTGQIRPAMDLGAHRLELAAETMAPVAVEVSDRQRRFRERELELSQQDVEREEEDLRAAGIPTARWPQHLPGAKAWTVLQAQRVAADGLEARTDFEARMQRLEARDARKRFRRSDTVLARGSAHPWWRRWFSRG